MTIHLDHTIVPSRDKVAAAKLLGELFDAPWAPYWNEPDGHYWELLTVSHARQSR